MNKNSYLCQSGEVFFFSVLMLTSGICTDMPKLYTSFSGTGAPLSAFISGLLIIILIQLFSKKLRLSTDGNIIQKAESGFGALGRFGNSLILLAYLFVSSAYLLSQASAFAQKLAFPTSPIWFVAAFFSLAALFGAVCGIQGLFCLSKLIVPAFVGIWVLLIVSVLWGCDFSNLFPILGNGVSPSIRGGFSGLIAYSNIVLFFLVNPTTHSTKATNRAFLWGAVVAAIINILTVLTYTAKIPYPMSAQEQFPLYLLSKEVYFGRFFQRIDAILLLTSSLFNMLSLSFNLCLILMIMKQVFRVSSRPIVLTASSLIIFLSVSGITLLPTQSFESLLAWLGTGLIAVTFIIALFVRKEAKSKNEI